MVLHGGLSGEVTINWHMYQMDKQAAKQLAQEEMSQVSLDTVRYIY